MSWRRTATLLLMSLLLTSCSLLSGRAAPSPQPGDGARGEQKGEPTIKPYAQVITAEAGTDSGLFQLHTIGSKLYYEIPDSLLDRDMLLISRIAAAPTGISQLAAAGSKVEEQLVRWERLGKRVLLRRYSYLTVADDSLPIAQSVQANNFAPIIAAFDVVTIGPDSSSIVIEVTDLFTGDVRAIGPLGSSTRTRFKVTRLDPDRTFIDEARSFPLNIEVEHTLTFEASLPPSDASTGTLSVQMSQSMVLLPAEPMRVRYADARVGWFTIERLNFGLDEPKAATQTIIRRWRLEPRDPEAYARGELVEPVKPIVFYLDPATPAKWRPYIKQGVEEWQVALEAAGFWNAILAKDPPSSEKDPEFSPDDVRYSMIRYVANLTRNARGPSVSDPRSGEIISSHILWYHNHLRSYRNRLIIETGASNPAARSIRLPDALLGEAVRQVIAHEVGHALGLQHNMIASSSVAVDSLRSPAFTARYGVSASIMDYARQNYIAQPGDGVERYIRRIGPYDRYAINWGYRLIADAAGPEAEKPTLDRWILEKADNPMYRFAGQSRIDPRAQTEDLGSDPVRASRYGIENLKRVMPHLIEWTTTPGEDYADLEEIYGELTGMWSRYLLHVVTLVGGVYENAKTADQDGAVYEPVPAYRQREAVRFLSDQVFTTPLWLQDRELLRCIEGSGAVERIRRTQVAVVDRLLEPARMQRLIEAEVFAPDSAYRVADMLADVKRAIWLELDRAAAIDAYRRNLQRGHLARLITLVNAKGSVANSDIKALARAQLRELRAEGTRAAPLAPDGMTRMHLEDIVARIDNALSVPGLRAQERLPR